MAAETTVPRMERTTTNMEDAAAAARARRAARGHGNVVDPDLVDNALADIEMARVFLDAGDRYVDELIAWFCPGGHAENSALHTEACNGQILMNEADDRLLLAQGRLRVVLDQAFSARSSAPDTAAWDAAYAEYQPIGDRWTREYDEADTMPPGKERDEAFDTFCVNVSGYQAARDKFMAVPAPTLAALALKMDAADKASDEHFDLCHADLRRLAGDAA